MDEEQEKGNLDFQREYNKKKCLNSHDLFEIFTKSALEGGDSSELFGYFADMALELAMVRSLLDDHLYEIEMQNHSDEINSQKFFDEFHKNCN
jgi:hypothetical protein